MRLAWKSAIALGAITAATPAWARPPDASFDRDAERQLVTDPTALPEGMGAVLVPRLRAQQESSVMVFDGGDLVARGRVGRKIPLAPGAYDVVVGQGPLEDRARVTVEVVEGEVVVPEPFFGAVRVQVVDRDGDATSTHYLIVDEHGAVVGGADSPGPDEGEPAAFALPPGTYSLVLGDDARPERGSVAFSLAPGASLQYRLVADQDDLLRSELVDAFERRDPSDLRLRWVLGASGSFSHRQETTTGFLGTVLLVDGYTRFQGGYDSNQHLALVTANAAQSLVSLDSEEGADVPLRTINSDAELELLYAFRPGRWAGPYVRGIGRTSFFNESFTPARDSVVETRDEAGELLDRERVAAHERVTTFDSLNPTSLQAGAGLAVSPVDGKVVKLMLRGGPAVRTAFYGGGRILRGVDGAEVEMMRIDDRDGFGAEATATGELNLGSVVSLETRFDSFLPAEQIGGDEDLLPLFRWDSTLAFRLSSFASAVYQVSLRREEVVFHDLQIAQNVALRLHYSVF